MVSISWRAASNPSSSKTETGKCKHAEGRHVNKDQGHGPEQDICPEGLAQVGQACNMTLANE